MRHEIGGGAGDEITGTAAAARLDAFREALGAARFDGAPQLRHAFGIDGRCLEDRHGSAAVRAQGQRALELMQRAVGAVEIGLVDDENVGDFQQPRLHGLDVVAEARRGDDDPHVGDVDDVDLALTRADGFHQDEIAAGRVERIEHAHGGGREAAEMPAACQRAHEHAVIVEGRGHADAVAEDGAAGYGTGGIDGDDADGAAVGADVSDEGVEQGRFARARRACDADDERAAEIGLHGRQQRRDHGRKPLQLGGHARHGVALARAHALHEVFRRLGRIDRGARRRRPLSPPVRPRRRRRLPRQGRLASLADFSAESTLRIATARYFAEHLAPETGALRTAVMEGAEAVLDVDPALLAG